MAASKSTLRWVKGTLAAAAAAVLAAIVGPRLRHREEMATCMRGVAPAYASAGADANAERLATFVCEELTQSASVPNAGSAEGADATTMRREGLMRVHVEVIGDLLAVRRAVVDAGPEACAVMWMGGDGSVQMRALAALPDETLRRYARTVPPVAAHGRAPSSAPRTTAAQATARFDEFLADLMDSEPGEALVLADAAPDDAALACGAHRALLGAIEALPPVERAEVARAWFVAELVDPVE